MIERYALAEDGIRPSPDGGYVLLVDHEREVAALRAALQAIVEKCAAPVNEMAQREAVHFAYNTARAAVNQGER